VFSYSPVIDPIIYFNGLLEGKWANKDESIAKKQVEIMLKMRLESSFVEKQKIF
jgi:hypothetical protein